MIRKQLEIVLQDVACGILKLPPASPIPDWMEGARFFSLTRTPEELSLVVDQQKLPVEVICDRDWRLLKVAGPLDFSMTGIIDSLANPLAKSGISVFSISTFDTDYVLVRQRDLSAALKSLREAGHSVLGEMDEEEGTV